MANKFFFFVIFIFTSACGRGLGGNGNNSDSGGFDPGETGDPEEDPFEGPDGEMVSFKFATSFNGAEEVADIRIRCGTQEVDGDSSETFKIRHGSTCTATLGDRARRTGSSSGNRPLHESGEGLLWTGAVDLEIGEEEIIASRINREDEVIDIAEAGATEIAFDGDWWFATPRMDCRRTTVGNGFMSKISANEVVVLEDNFWQAGSISGSASWFVNIGSSFDWGAGDAFERGWRITSVELGGNHFFATIVTQWGHDQTLDCEWK